MMMSLTFVFTFIVSCETIKEQSCNKLESSFNVDDVWMNFRGNGVH